MSIESATEVIPASESPAADSNSSSGYSVTDPGYDSVVPDEVENDLDALRAENTKAKPSETSDDASDSNATEEAAAEPADDAAESDDISDELLDRAFELGYTLDEMKSFSDVKSLEKEIARVEKLQKRVQERQAGRKPQTQESLLPPENATPEPNWEQLIEQGHDPDIIALQKTISQRAERAEAMARQLLQTEQNRALESQCDRFDDALNKLEGFQNILGTGRRGEIAKSSPEQADNRQRVFTKMLVLKEGYERAGEKVPAEAELIQEAVQASFYKQAQQTARSELKTQIKKAGSQALSRPRSGGEKPLSGPSLALVKENEFWKKMRVE